ncbi:hypothetical protein ACEPAI_1381 [Sanghuangporus weigelae]
MASSADEIKGAFVVTARVEAHPGKADELAQWFANIKARADSSEEPGCLQYNIVRFGDSFAVYEEYTAFEAFTARTTGSPLFREFLKISDTLMKPVVLTYWSAKSLPAPTVTF